MGPRGISKKATVGNILHVLILFYSTLIDTIFNFTFLKSFLPFLFVACLCNDVPIFILSSLYAAYLCYQFSQFLHIEYSVQFLNCVLRKHQTLFHCCWLNCYCMLNEKVLNVETTVSCGH